MVFCDICLHHSLFSISIVRKTIYNLEQKQSSKESAGIHATKVFWGPFWELSGKDAITMAKANDHSGS
jgi:hypothetical protein